jgi:hypothetical protein
VRLVGGSRGRAGRSPPPGSQRPTGQQTSPAWPGGRSLASSRSSPSPFAPTTLQRIRKQTNFFHTAIRSIPFVLFRIRCCVPRQPLSEGTQKRQPQGTDLAATDNKRINGWGPSPAHLLIRCPSVASLQRIRKQTNFLHTAIRSIPNSLLCPTATTLRGNTKTPVSGYARARPWLASGWGGVLAALT